MKNQQFIDISKLESEDYDKIKLIMKEKSIDFNKALIEYMHENPDKVRVVGEFKDGRFHRDEITQNGVSEYKDNEALDRMINDVKNNKEK